MASIAAGCVPVVVLLSVAVLGILLGCRSSHDLQKYPKRHCVVLNQAMGLNFKRWPSDFTTLYLYRSAEA